MTPFLSMAPHMDPEPAPWGQGLSPRAPYCAGWEFSGKLCLTWKAPVCWRLFATAVKGNAPGSIFSLPESCFLHPAIATSPTDPGAT